MTRHLVDVAVYQGSLAPAAVKLAGFAGVNLKISHGLGQQSVHPEIASWALKARSLGLNISTFHWLTGETSGEDQAEHAYRRLAALGLTSGTAHQLDVESSPRPSLSSVRGYLGRMRELLGRPVALYTGDWYWPAGWDVTDLTGHLWSAPRAGYLGRYPGDGSAHWAGYGGWDSLAVMQYAVARLPGTSINVSMSAVRDEAVWRSLTTGGPALSYAPDKIMEARKLVMDTLRAAGKTVNPASYGVVGDDSHANAGTGYHLGKDALKSSAYSIVESSRDRNGLTNAVAAFDWGDFSIAVKGKRHDLQSMSLWMVAQCKAGAADTLDVREIIYSPDGKVVKRWDRLGIRTSGDDSHLSHTHFSWFRDSEKRDKTALFRRYFTEIGLLEDPMATLDNDDINKIRAALKAELAIDPTASIFARTGYLANAFAPAALDALSAILKNVQADDADTAAVLGAIASAQDGTIRGVVAALASPSMSDADVAAALRAVLGARSAAVGAILKG